jgi:hypothetical protein
MMLKRYKVRRKHNIHLPDAEVVSERLTTLIFPSLQGNDSSDSYFISDAMLF